MDKKKEIVDLSPQNSEYAEKIARARAVSHPIGGMPMPKIPNMADAQGQGDRYAGVQGQRRAQGMATVMTPEQRASLDSTGRGLPGIGSAYVANQPALRQSPPPQEYQNPPRPAGAGLSAKTAEQLEAVAKANIPESEKKTEAKSQEDEISEALDEVFDFDEFGNKMKDLLANKERRDLIESRCEALSLMDLLVDRELRQVVPILPNKYYPTFRTMSGDEDLEIKRLVSFDKGSETYVYARFAVLNLTCGLYAMNGKVLPDHLKEGAFNKELFLEKYKSIAKYPVQILADLNANYIWFDRRVRALIAFDAIKDF